MQTLRYLGYFIRHDRGAQIGFAIIGVMLALIVLAPYLAFYDPIEANPDDILQPPSAAHWFGTDSSGLDIYSRVLYAPRVDMVIAVAGVGGSTSWSTTPGFPSTTRSRRSTMPTGTKSSTST
jgi:peptide/nickel transport system permease protein